MLDPYSSLFARSIAISLIFNKDSFALANTGHKNLVLITYKRYFIHLYILVEAVHPDPQARISMESPRHTGHLHQNHREKPPELYHSADLHGPRCQRLIGSTAQHH